MGRTASPLAGAGPIIKWAGGKGQLLGQYERYFPHPDTYDAYFEPFVGGAAVFFHLAPRLEGKFVLLADSNPELVNLYRMVQSRPDDLIALLQWHGEQHGRDHYYAVREASPADPVARAARTVYLNKTCYNGLYRVNRKGQFNVPMGAYRRPAILNEAGLRAASHTLRKLDVQFAVQDFGAMVAAVRARTPHRSFVYFDPPYQPVSATASFTSYTHHTFGEDEQCRLAGVFAALAAGGARVMLSNSYHPLIRRLYDGFHRRRVLANRSINSRPDRRGPIYEYVICSYPVPAEPSFPDPEFAAD